jgi:gliding motility-associated-like protein
MARLSPVVWVFLTWAWMPCTPAFTQFLSNPSFEGTPMMSVPPPGWKACNLYSSPDTQPGSFYITKPASHQQSYLSLFARGSVGYITDNIPEAAGTRLLKPLKSKVCHTISVDLAHEPASTFVHMYNGKVIYCDIPVSFNVWGAFSECTKAVLLYRSEPISNQQWQTYTFSVTPEYDFNYLILEVGDVGNKAAYGNVLIDNMQIQVPTLDLGKDQILCQGSTKQLVVDNPGGTTEWSTGSTENNITVTESGKYSVKVSQAGCIERDTVDIQFLPSLNISLGNDTTLCAGDTLLLKVTTPRGKYLWSTGSSEPIQKITKDGLYSVKVDNGCETADDAIALTFNRNTCCALSAPNIFTPNGDLLNEYFELSSPSAVTKFDLAVYNRWGKIVFRANDLNRVWDGNTGNHEKAAEGVYFWTVSMVCAHKGKFFDNTFRGTITLTR